MMLKILLFFSISVFCSTSCNADKPCAPRQIKGKSVVCVCNVTYCDTITRVAPTEDTYVTYTSSKDGLRFKKDIHNFEDVNCSSEALVLDPEIKYQTIQGFGGAATDSTGINWKSLPQPLQQYLIDSYFSDQGLEYNMIRVPIGGTDFSTHPYAYNLYPENDTKLSNFTLAFEDYEYKIPVIKAAMKASKIKINIVATTWSPAPWMKTTKHYVGLTFLKKEYYSTYALYHLKFLERYSAEGINVWAITTTNEPTNGMIGITAVNCLGWSAGNMGKWIVNDLGPMLRNSTFKDVLILLGDDQRLTIPYWINLVILEHPNVLDYIDGLAIHYYTDFIAPPSLLSELSLNYPDKFILSTEACAGSGWLVAHHVDIGSWDRAKRYIQDIITDLTYEVTGWIDWNMCLNEQGGPTWTGNYVDSPIIVYPEKKEFVKEPMFYGYGQFTKFIPRGSRRIKVTLSSEILGPLSYVAFLTPYNTAVIVVYNDGDARTVQIQLSDKCIAVEMVAHSVTTVELKNKEEIV